MSKIAASLILLITVLSIPDVTLAAYVLPYPSFMPGNKLYTVMRFLDEVKRYWYWGNLASYRYFLGQSDKALVEAKTLFEYRQYLLATDALSRSNTYFQKAPDSLRKAQEEGKDIKTYEQELAAAAAEHKKILMALIEDTPEEFVWKPEREEETILSIREDLMKAIQLRK
jgi:hypothetical protein